MIFNNKKKLLGLFLGVALALSSFAGFSANTVFSKNTTTVVKHKTKKAELNITKVIKTQIENPTIVVPELEKEKKEKERKEKEKISKLSKIEKMQNKLFNMGIADLSDLDEDEPLEIHKKNTKKSKVVGVLADGGSMTIIEQVGKWYKIKSGSIKGYVPVKHILVDDDAQDYIEENKFLTAKITKNQVLVLSKADKNSSAVGIGYKDSEYPIEQFSDNDKYAYVERTETIMGWIPVSDMKLTISSPTAMSEEEYEQYQKELEAEEQKALESYLNVSVGSTGNKLQDGIIELIAHNESGNFKDAHNAKTGGEKTITVGAWQWYGENAHNLLRLICGSNTSKAKKIIDSAFSGKDAKKKAKDLYKDITGHNNWESDKRKFTKKELIAIKGLLGSDAGLTTQKTKIQTDIKSKIGVAINTYKLSDDGLTTYFCDMFWQSPDNARAVVKACIKHYKTAKKFCKAKDNLKYMHETAVKNGVFKKYAKRRNYTYSFCKKLK